MKNRKFSIAAFIIAVAFWFFEEAIHYFAHNEPQFKVMPEDSNELWMRAVVIVLIIILGIKTDYSTRKLLIKEKQLEATRIYGSMLHAAHHILNNLLNQMQLFKMEALERKDFDQETIKLFDKTFAEALDLIKRLSEIENITDENIWKSVAPNSEKNSSNKPNAVDAENRVAD